MVRARRSRAPWEIRYALTEDERCRGVPIRQTNSFSMLLESHAIPTTRETYVHSQSFTADGVKEREFTEIVIRELFATCGCFKDLFAEATLYVLALRKDVENLREHI